MTAGRTVEKLLRQQGALAAFGSFAFRNTDLQAVLTEAARTSAASLGVPHAKICRYRPDENDLLIEAGCGWQEGVVGLVVSKADETSPQGRAYVTGEPVIIRNLAEANHLVLPSFYESHGITSTVDVLIPGIGGPPYGVLEVDSVAQHDYDEHDITFLTGFANVLAEAVAAAGRTRAMRALLDERKLMAEELQHRVRNNLQMISSMLASYARTSPEGEQRQAVDSIVRQVIALAQVYDTLLGVGLSQSIDFGSYLGELCRTLPALQRDGGTNARLVYHACTVPLGLDHVTALGMIVAEIVTNSYGHAFSATPGTITVSLAIVASSDSAMLTIADDGSGFTPDPGSTRRGLTLIARLVKQIGGTAECDSGNGTTWTVIFPYAPPTGGPHRLSPPG